MVVNNILVALQFFVYFPLMFLFIRRRKRYLRDNYSDSDYLRTRWIPGFLLLLCILFFLVMLVFIIWPQTDIWLIPLANIIAMGYLVYNVISRSTTAYINRLPDTTEVRAHEDPSHRPVMETRQMKEISEQIVAYLRDSRAYRNQDLTLAALSLETGIHHRNISIAINGYLHKNFFDLVNGMRVEEAKQLLRELSTSDYTTESIFTECGFRSRSTFFTTFRKFEGTSPAQWLKSIRG